MRVERPDSSRADHGLVLISPAMVRAFLLLIGFAFRTGAFTSFGMGFAAAAGAAAVGGLENTCLRLGGKCEVESEILNLQSWFLMFVDNFVLFRGKEDAGAM